MSRIALVTNTIAALPPDLTARHGITILPMLINFLDGAYEEGVDIDEVEFYERLEREVVVPATSAPTVSRYLRAFQELAAEHDTILSIQNRRSAGRQVFALGRRERWVRPRR